MTIVIIIHCCVEPDDRLIKTRKTLVILQLRSVLLVVEFRLRFVIHCSDAVDLRSSSGERDKDRNDAASGDDIRVSE